MTLARAAKKMRAPLAAASALFATCVFPGVDLGRVCTSTSECYAPAVCVLVDESEPDGEAVCLPMLELDAPHPCVADEECAAAGWPVDAFCNDEGRCTCNGDGFSECDGDDEVFGEHTCRCLQRAFLGTDCEDDNQCDGEICGGGTCSEGNDGDGCDSDADCEKSASNTCTAGSCA